MAEIRFNPYKVDFVLGQLVQYKAQCFPYRRQLTACIHYIKRLAMSHHPSDTETRPFRCLTCLSTLSTIAERKIRIIGPYSSKRTMKPWTARSSTSKELQKTLPSDRRERQA